MSNAIETYRGIVAGLVNAGFERTIPLVHLQNAILSRFSLHQPSAFKFHIKNMENLGLIRQHPSVSNLWEVCEDVAEDA